MDALTDNKEARIDIVNQISDRFKDIESNPNTQIYASFNDKIIKLNKQLLISLKN